MGSRSTATGAVWLQVGLVADAVREAAAQEDEDSFWRCVCDRSRWIVPAPRLAIIEPSGDDSVRLRVRRERAAILDSPETSFARTGDPIGASLSSHVPAWIERAALGRPDADALRSWLIGPGGHELLIVPVRHRGDPLAALCFAFDRPVGRERASILGGAALFATQIATIHSLMLARTELVDKNRQLEQSNRDLEEFASAASHDLRAPLRAIDKLTDWLAEDLAPNLSGESRQTMDLIRSRVRRLDRLLVSLLEYSRVGRARPFVETIDVGTLVGEIVESRETPAGIAIAIAGELPTIKTNSVGLRQVLANLIGNAIKHHDGDCGRVEITAEDRGDFVELAITDDGPGIPTRFHDKIFKMFETLQSRDEVEGSGMGLALVHRQVELAGGEVRVVSEDGERGTSMRFSWPKRWPHR